MIKNESKIFKLVIFELNIRLVLKWYIIFNDNLNKYLLYQKSKVVGINKIHNNCLFVVCKQKKERMYLVLVRDQIHY